MQEKDMLNELIVESKEHLQNIEPDLLELEEKGDGVSDSLINRVFRAIHSIKGGFGFFGLTKIVSLSHAMENVMSRIRDKKISVSADVTDALLLGIDTLRVMLDDVDASDGVSIEDELNKLKPHLEASSVQEAGTNSRKEIEARSESSEIQKDIHELHPRLTDSQLMDAVRNGKLVYHVSLDPVNDVAGNDISFTDLFTHWERLGEILDCIPDRETMEKETTELHSDVSVIYATVLEADLISEGINVPQEKIYALDLNGIKEKLKDKGNEQSQSDGAKGPVSDSASAKGKKYEPRIEEALRVKVSLLNNLMTYAGELVLARNQLVQLMNRPFASSVEAQKTIRDTADLVKHSLMKSQGEKKGALSAPVPVPVPQIETEVAHIEKSLKDSLNFHLSDIQGINSIIQNIDMVTTILQEHIMQTRMQPISVVFSKFPRVIRDLAKKLGKEISLTQIGQEVELDKSIIELLSDPLTHLVRNCADHGIESPDTRIKAGKNSRGEVLLRAYQEGGKVIIQIEDDGAGIDPEKIKAKAIEKGVIEEEAAAELPDKDAYMLIFTPGFSTAQEVSDVSGRGVGMDVVKSNIERLGGTVEVDSVLGMNTTITMKLPLTLAIIPSLIITAEDRRFAIPQVGLEEVVRIRTRDITEKIEQVHGSEVLRLRGKLLPIIRLSKVLGLESTFSDPRNGGASPDMRQRWSDRRKKKGDTQEDNGERRTGNKDRRHSLSNAIKVVVLRLDNHMFGLVVDDVQDSEEIVVKPLPEYLKSSICYSGATIMGDGRVAMIIDPNGVAQMADLHFDELEKESSEEKHRYEKEWDKQLDVLVFSIGGTEHFAVDLADVARIEKRKADELEKVGKNEFLKYEHSSLHILRLENILPVQGPSEKSEDLLVIVPKSTGVPFGIITHAVEDAVRTELTIDATTIKGTGIEGTALINHKMVIVVKMAALVEYMENKVGQTA